MNNRKCKTHIKKAQPKRNEEIEFAKNVLSGTEKTRQNNMQKALGRRVGEIAHEISTPIQYVGDNLRFCLKETQNLFNAFDVLSKIIGSAEKQGLLASSILDYRSKYKQKEIDVTQKEILLSLNQAIEGADQVMSLAQVMREASFPAQRTKVLVDINRVVQSAATISSGEWKKIANVDLKLKKSLPRVKADERALIQVVLNLIVNAVHSIDKRKPKAGKITLRTEQEAKSIRLIIEDNGIGIPKDIKDRIFDRYFTTKEHQGGTGQGLAIVYEEVVERHGGNIEINSKEGEGTAVTISFPANF